VVRKGYLLDYVGAYLSQELKKGLVVAKPAEGEDLLVWRKR
jgi:hypothetical protein